MLNNKAIILIEDDQVDIMSFKRCLKELRVDNNLYIFENGNEFLGFKQNNPQIQIGIIFLDLNTPCISGLEFLAQIREDEEFRLFPIVIVSTSVEENDVKTAYIYGVKGYINKSVDNDQYFRQIELCLKYWDSQNLMI